MRVLTFTKGSKSVPSSNFRVWILSDFLRKKYGWEFTFFHSISYPFFSLDTRRFKLWRDVLQTIRNSKFDIIFVHKVHFPFDVAILITLIKYLYRLPLVYDIDDPQWINSRGQDFILSRIADRIFCSSYPFLEHYKKISSKVTYIPTVLDHTRYSSFKVSYNEKEIYTIGWVGDGVGHFKTKNFHIIKPVLENLANDRIKFVFRIIGTKKYKPLEDFIKSDKYQIDLVAQVPFNEIPHNIQTFDIGVAPVQDIEWFRINATAKGVEYMACGVPVVANPVGAYNDLIRDGENGFLARSTEEWVEKIKLLLANKELRKKIGEEGLKTVCETYSYESILPKIEKEFNLLCK